VFVELSLCQSCNQDIKQTNKKNQQNKQKKTMRNNIEGNSLSSKFWRELGGESRANDER